MEDLQDTNNSTFPNEGVMMSYDDDDESDAESGGEDVSKSSHDHFLQEQEQQQRKKLARNETRAISYLRVLVIFFMVCTAAIVSLGVYFYATNDEQEEFESAFEIHGTKVMESFRDAIERRVGAVGAMSDAITNYALHNDRDERFPFLTIPNFEILGSDIRVQAEALIVHYAPLVTDDQRLEWEEYAYVHRHQIDESFVRDVTYRKEEDEFFGLGLDEQPSEPNREGGGRKLAAAAPIEEKKPDPNILPDGSQYHLRIWNNLAQNVTADGTGPYLPLWQRSPVNGGKQVILNLNWAETKSMRGIVDHALKEPKPQVILSRASVPNEFAKKQVKKNLGISQFRYQGEEYLEDPLTFLFYPIFDSFNSTSRNLAGMLLVNLYWRLFFTDILPATAKGIICILENSYNQTLAYRIDGKQVTFLGEGDQHDTTYDDLVISEDLTAYVNSRAGPKTRAYKTLPLHGTVGKYKLRIYPSKETEEQYTSNKPILYTLVVSSVFLVTACVFGLFDFIVQRRQRIVMKKAVQSGALVSSLFPEQVQKQLFEQTSRSFKSENTWKAMSMTGSSRNTNDPFATSMKPAYGQGTQIANLYPETTILFADLAGFTQWSSNRAPCDVFELLETLYKSFDRIAARRKVFKVETIGDCYLAACGLPEPNKHHACVMAKFARDCSVRMNDIVRKVSDVLGPDTAMLQLRVGLHSGPVTAGVLRGQKSRFQLFGDTVNTASRMESTGQPGRIQASQATADELIADGKRAWLKKREDKVNAKGKGELTTYWVMVQSVGSVTSGTESDITSDSISAEHCHQRRVAAPSTIDEEDGEGNDVNSVNDVNTETFSNEMAC